MTVVEATLFIATIIRRLYGFSACSDVSPTAGMNFDHDFIVCFGLFYDRLLVISLHERVGNLLAAVDRADQHEQRAARDDQA